MKAVQAFGRADIRVVDVEIPSPKKDEALIKVRACGVCGSDKWLWNVNRHIPFIAGHEIAGEVAAIGSEGTGLTLGDRVIVATVVGCGICPACQSGAFALCERKDGIADAYGGYAEFAIAPARNCQRLDGRLSFTQGALIMDNWGTPYNAIEKMNLSPGQVVMVYGLGPIGQAAVALLKLQHAHVIGIDPVAYRRAYALKCGADNVYAPDDGLCGSVLAQTHGMGAHFVLECSGNAMAYDMGINLLRIGGMFVCIGEEAQFFLRPSEGLMRRSLSIQGSWYSTLPQAQVLQQLAVDQKIDPTAFLTHRLPGLESLSSIFGDIVACKEGLIKAVVEIE